MIKTKLGRFGEDLAIEFLQKQGYRIIERNFRIRGGEIDAIAQEGNTLVYVEIKTRTTFQFGRPEEAVTPKKIHFLKRAAKFYRNNRKPLIELERIDVVAVDLLDHANPQIKLIKNATF